MKQEKVGKVSHDLLLKTPDKISVHEQQEAMQEDYLKNLSIALQDGISHYQSSFYVVIITKRERLMPNVFRNYFMTRLSCPTPDYDQTVYYYEKNDDQVRYMWTLPSKDACFHLQTNALVVDKSERELLQFVLDFADGTLDRRAKELNGEQKDSPLLQGV